VSIDQEIGYQLLHQSSLRLDHGAPTRYGGIF